MQVDLGVGVAADASTALSLAKHVRKTILVFLLLVRAQFLSGSEKGVSAGLCAGCGDTKLLLLLMVVGFVLVAHSCCVVQGAEDFIVDIVGLEQELQNLHALLNTGHSLRLRFLSQVLEFVDAESMVDGVDERNARVCRLELLLQALEQRLLAAAGGPAVNNAPRGSGTIAKEPGLGSNQQTKDTTNETKRIDKSVHLDFTVD